MCLCEAKGTGLGTDLFLALQGWQHDGVTSRGEPCPLQMQRCLLEPPGPQHQGPPAFRQQREAVWSSGEQHVFWAQGTWPCWMLPHPSPKGLCLGVSSPSVTVDNTPLLRAAWKLTSTVTLLLPLDLMAGGRIPFPLEGPGLPSHHLGEPEPSCYCLARSPTHWGRGAAST